MINFCFIIIVVIIGIQDAHHLVTLDKDSTLFRPFFQGSFGDVGDLLHTYTPPNILLYHIYLSSLKMAGGRGLISFVVGDLFRGY